MPANENIVELKIFDFDSEHGQITDMLGLAPTKVWVRGEEYIFGDKRNGLKKTRENNYWEYRSTNISNDWIGNHIDKFIDEIILPRKDVLRSISEKLHTELSIVQYIYEGCNPGLYFNKKALKAINDCGLELNIDLYVLSEIDKK
ncbi:DUF4279 domain-containing protein [Pontibacter beigongshangensis]|uniref:DUF4279 domain-containing protein n=1 Tax=Pontibacter beigongshangensis TaxID=2574733 RepID=UPI00164F9B6C|nr:DUF4279 domain-containing protein [Pontibacter beigongshangensis]